MLRKQVGKQNNSEPVIEVWSFALKVIGTNWHSAALTNGGQPTYGHSDEEISNEH